MFIANDLIEYVGLREMHKIKDVPVVIVKITGDMNDGDYLTTETEFELAGEYAEETLDELKALTKIVKEHKTEILSRHVADKYLNYECIDNEDIYKFFNSEFLDFPFMEDRRCHTIESIEFFYKDENGTIVELEVI